jgi:calcium-independent phospholipase A2-gamma
VIVVEVLKAIERETGKSVHELFDYIVGVSTGAILTTLLGPLRRNLDECEELYMSLCKELFSDPGWWGTGRLFMSHSLYDTSVWETILKEHIGDVTFEESSADPDCPKVDETVHRSTSSSNLFYLLCKPTVKVNSTRFQTIAYR